MEWLTVINYCEVNIVTTSLPLVPRMYASLGLNELKVPGAPSVVLLNSWVQSKSARVSQFTLLKVPGLLIKSQVSQLVPGTGTDDLGPTWEVPGYPRISETSQLGLLDLGLTLTRVDSCMLNLQFLTGRLSEDDLVYGWYVYVETRVSNQGCHLVPRWV